MAGLMSPQPPQPPQAGTPAPAPNAPPAAGPTPPQPGAQPPQSGGAQAPKGPPIGMGPVDPELLKKFIANCMNVVTQTLPQIVKMVQQDQDKIDALAHSTVFVVMRVEDSLEQSGQQLNINMTLNGGAETLSDIADAMKKAGAFTYNDQQIQAAFLRAVDMYRMARQQQGRLDPKMFQQQLAQMQQQEQAGTLEKSFPGLSKFAAASQKGSAPAQAGQPAQPGQGDGAGQDAEDAQDQGSDEDSEGEGSPAPAGSPAPKAPAAPPQPGQNFPANMLKKKPAGGGPISVKAHSRKARTNKPKPQKAGPNDFPAKMLAKGKPKPNPKGA